MGIRPNRDGIIPPVSPDNPETRYSDWLTDLEDSGEIVGGVWKETDAKATSAKDGVDDLAGLISTHKHVSSDITDTTPFVDSSLGVAGRIPRTGSDGWLYSRDNPTHENHLARKGYVDSAIDGHTHTADEITGKTGWVDSTFGIAGSITVTGSDGFLHSRDNPTSENHLARKGYVDQTVSPLEQRIAAAEALLKNAIIAVPPANLSSLPAGQVYLDVSTLTIHTK